jgi:hypothetical protein
MAIMAKASGGGNFTPCPEGTHAAVCVDVVDLGMLEVTFAKKTKAQHKIRIVWQIDEARDDGKPHMAMKRYTLSLHEKAALRKDLESWRGKAFTDEQLAGFDVEVLLGVGALINVMHNKKDGETYANVTAIMKLPKTMEAPHPREYVRVVDRKPEGVGEAAAPDDFEGQPFPTDDDVPF